MINTTLTITASFLGIIAGIALAKISPEELKPGEKHFKILKIVLLALIIFFSLIIFSIQSNLLLLSIITCYIIIKKYKDVHLSFDYILFAMILASMTNIDHLHVTSSLIFLYGLPAGTLLVKR